MSDTPSPSNVQPCLTIDTMRRSVTVAGRGAFSPSSSITSSGGYSLLWTASPPSPSPATTMDPMSGSKDDTVHPFDPRSRFFVSFIRGGEVLSERVERYTVTRREIDSALETNSYPLALLDEAKLEEDVTPMLPKWHEISKDFRLLGSHSKDLGYKGLMRIYGFLPLIVTLLDEAAQSSDRQRCIDHFGMIHSNKDFENQAAALNELQDGFSVVKEDIELFNAILEEQREELDEQIPSDIIRVNEEIIKMEARLKEVSERHNAVFFSDIQTQLVEKTGRLANLEGSQTRYNDKLRPIITSVSSDVQAVIGHLDTLIETHKMARNSYWQLHTYARNLGSLEEMDIDLMRGDIELAAACFAELEAILMAFSSNDCISLNDQ